MMLKKSKQRGLTLIELMIAMALSLMLAAGAVMIFTSNKQTAVFQEGFSRLQENGRFAMDILQTNLRMAGGTGCGGVSEIINLLKYPNDFNGGLYNFGAAVMGFEYTGSGGNDKTDWTPNLPDVLDDTVTANTDVIMLHTSTSCGAGIEKDPAAPSGGSSANLHVTKGPEAASGVSCVNECQIAMAVSEACDVAAVFRVVNDPSTGGSDFYLVNENTATPKCNGHGNGTKEMPDMTGGDLYMPGVDYYYITDSTNSEKTSLWRIAGDIEEDSITPVGVELVEGITDMQFTYFGNSGADFETADGISGNDWENVKGIRIELDVETVNSTEDIEKVFTTTVAIRNKVL